MSEEHKVQVVEDYPVTAPSNDVATSIVQCRDCGAAGHDYDHEAMARSQEERNK